MRDIYYALVGIMDDTRHARYLFWRACMRGVAKLHALLMRVYSRADALLLRWHTAAHLRAARLDRRRDGR